METWVIFKVWLLINFLVNVAETFIDSLNIIFVKWTMLYFVKCVL